MTVYEQWNAKFGLETGGFGDRTSNGRSFEKVRNKPEARKMVSTPMGQNGSDACALCDALGICWLKLSIPSTIYKMR